MSYCTFEQYLANGGHHTSEDFTQLLPRAEGILDRLTLGRAALHREALAEELALADTLILDALYAAIQELESTPMGISSASNDGVSTTFRTASALSFQLDSRCLGLLREALGADRFGLLYRGI